MESDFSMGKAIKKACVDTGITQGELAERIGVSRTRMSTMANSRHISTKQVQAICKALGMEESVLVGMAKNQTGTVVA